MQQVKYLRYGAKGKPSVNSAKQYVYDAIDPKPDDLAMNRMKLR